MYVYGTYMYMYIKYVCAFLDFQAYSIELKYSN